MVAKKPKVIEKKQLTQLGFNRVLWKMLSTVGGIEISANELINMPVNAALSAKYDAATDKFVVTPIVRQPNSIIVPGVVGGGLYG